MAGSRYDIHALPDGTTWPTAEMAAEASDRLRYGPSPDYAAAMVVETYLHLLTHPAGTKRMIRQLLAVRRAHREARDGR